METKELIAIIDDAIRAMEPLPPGHRHYAPEALQNLTPAQMLGLADHYKVEPSFPYSGSNRLQISLWVGQCGVSARSAEITMSGVTPRELLNAANTVAQ